MNGKGDFVKVALIPQQCAYFMFPYVPNVELYKVKMKRKGDCAASYAVSVVRHWLREDAVKNHQYFSDPC